MNNKILITGAFLALTATMNAQQNNGAISQNALKQIENASGVDANKNKALYNAITANSIDALAKNHNNAGAVDSYFSVETPTQNIHNQKSSGRCWMFTGLNVLRANFAKENNNEKVVEFSQSYLFFYDQLEKANLMLQGVINTAKKPLDNPEVQFFFKNPVSDGGTFCGVADLVEKYGLVPMSVAPETYSSENTARMGKIISSKLREFGLELRSMVENKKTNADIQKRKNEMLGTVYRILAMTLGEPVKQFTYAFKDAKGKIVGEEKQYTPQSFYNETVGKQLNGSFIMVMNDPHRPYYKTYEIEYDRHTYDGHNWKYINLPMQDIASMAIASLKDGKKMYSSYDVGKQFDRQRGFSDTKNYDYGSLFDTSFTMNKEQRIATFDSGSTHAMTLTAVDLDANGNPIKWKVENSWGADNGHNGYIIMTNRWFNEYMFRLVVDKKYVPENILKLEQQKPVMLKYDDPLFSTDDKIK